MYNTSYAQPFPFSYTKAYHPYGNYEFDYKESYITQKFYKDSNSSFFNFDGTIIVQRVNNTSIPDDPIQITLVDYKGWFMKFFLIFENIPGTFTPTCAAYNKLTQQYCIAGITENHPATSDVHSWFLFLDNHLNVIDAVEAGVALPSATSPILENLIVTDITSMEGTSSTGLGDFTFVGVAGNTTDPTPVNFATASNEKEVYVGYISSTAPYFGPTRAIMYSPGPSPDFAIENRYVPSRIVEIPLASPDGGFVIAGSVYGEEVFFTRLDYNLANNGTTQQISSADYPMYIGDLYFDPVEEEVWIAGSFYHQDESAIIYQKLIDLNLSGVTFYPDLYATASQNFGKFNIPGVPNFVKVAKIMPTDTVYEGAVAFYSLETANFSNPDNYNVPMLHKIKYDDNSLDAVGAGVQSVDSYTYPRKIGNLGLLNFLSYLDYYNLWYPVHWAHELPLSTDYDTIGSYVLGSSGYIDTTGFERIVLNRTKKYYEHDCNLGFQTLFDWYLPYSSTILTPGSDTDILSYTNLSTATTSDTISFYDCIIDSAFRQASPQHIESKKASIFEAHSTLHILSDLSDGYYCLYSSYGARLSKGKMDKHHIELSLNHLSAGLYFVEVSDGVSFKQVFKFTKF